MPTVLRSTLIVIAALTAAPTLAQNKNPAPPTAKELADGWVMIFDGETTFGWKVEGEAKVKDGKLVIGGAKPTKLTTTTEFGPFGFSFDYTIPDGKAAKEGSLLYHKAKQNHCICKFDQDTLSFTGGPPRELNDGTGPLVIELPANQIIHIERFLLKPGGMAPLFNGKDLKGWKVFADPKRSASKWEVTKAGELHLSNGPGDLQTEKTFDNFALQLECKTNGKELNSGVFFRCLPDQYQQGYEAQIHNGYKDNDRTKPSDFGTGAIYRRVAARKVVANDNEWFSLTVLAIGPRIATWVNGYQVIDWTDDREPKDNPRQGLRTAAGHLSLQGHDKTTDILFKNIRAAEMRKKD